MSWEVSTLGEACELYQPKTISGKDMVADGAYLVFGANGIIGRYDQYNHEAPQLVIGCRGSCGSVHVTEPFSWITGNSMVVKPKTRELDLKFMEYLLRGGVDISETITGTAQPQITRKSLAPIQISYPPLPEQQRIVGKLDAAFAALREAEGHVERNRANARELFESYLNGVFEGKGDGWVEKTLQEICIIGDGNHSSNYPRKDELVPDGVPFIRATNMIAGRICGTDMRYLAPEKHAQLKKGHLKTGDILITNRGEIGKTAIVDSAFDNANLNSQIAWLRCRSGVNNMYLYHVLNSGLIQAHFQATKSGTALQQFTIKQLKELRIPLPSFVEQCSIADQFDTLHEQTSKLGATYQQKLSELDALKKGLLGAAFRGEL